MRTAMEELLGFIEQMYDNAKTIEVESAMNDIINLITQQGIDIEKRQIIDAYQDGMTREETDLDKEFGISFSMEEYYAKEYYAKTYQNNL